GYEAETLRLYRRPKRIVVVRLYRPELQWHMYGAVPARTQSHPAIRLKPPFRVVWSRGLGTLVEFPAVVDDGMAYLSDFKGRVRAISMRNGKIVWQHDTPNG